MSPALIGRCNNNIGVAWIDDKLVDAGMLVDLEDPLPGLAPVLSPVEPAIAAITPQRPVSSNEHFVRVFRIDPDLSDVPGVLQTHVLPRLPAVGRLVDTVAVGNASLRLVLPCSDPDRLAITWIKFDNANGI